MSADTLHTIAENDTPQAVHVPKDLNGLVVWAIGRFGGGILLAAVCVWGLSKVYEDMTRQTDRMMLLLEARSKSDSELAIAILGLRTAIDEIAKESRQAHKSQ